MTCPFKYLFAGPSAPTPETKDVSTCPFASVFSGDDRPVDSGESNDTICHAESSGRSDTAADGSGASAQSCPLGFGSSSGPKFSILHCRLCQSLLYDCVHLGCCENRFCKFCIERFDACPLCGADIADVVDDNEVQAVVDKYIEVHSKNHTLWELDSGLPQEKVDDPLGMDRCSTSFYLQLGLRSYMGGNLEAAKFRLGQCCEGLETQLCGNGGENETIRCQLGAVCGSLGDCSRKLGDTKSSMSYFERSSSHLKAVPGNSEAMSELSVTLNKLGDLHFCENNISAARDCYSEALDVRRIIVRRDRDTPAEQLLELAVSLTKVADAEQVLEKRNEADAAFREARKILKRVKKKQGNLNGSQVGLLESLVGFLNEQKS